MSLFDGSNCGLELTDQPGFRVQYHPEASPGPHGQLLSVREIRGDDAVRLAVAIRTWAKRARRRRSSSLSACATPRLHSEDELNRAGLHCGLAYGELIQDTEPRSADPVSGSAQPRAASCVYQWARKQSPEARRHRLHQIPRGIMPKRTDISSILIIGAGPIVIGQAAEFDYSGSQAVKALKAEGYRVIVVNSNPATIMTDPEHGRRDLYRADHARDRRQDHREGAARCVAADDGRADRAQHRAGLAKDGTLERLGVELIGANAEVIEKAEDRPEIPRGDGPDRPRKPAFGDRP